VLVAFVLCITGYSDISYDGTAFASVLASGARPTGSPRARPGAASVGFRS
jgi:ABC-2 type transport system permease protein